jgi:hypothetical protein
MEITSSIYIIDGSFCFLDFFTTENICGSCWHPRTTPPTSNFNWKYCCEEQEKEQQKKFLGNVETNKQKGWQRIFSYYFLSPTFSCLSLWHYCSFNIWVKLCRQMNAERTPWFILYFSLNLSTIFFLSLPYIILLFKHHHFLWQQRRTTRYSNFFPPPLCMLSEF